MGRGRSSELIGQDRFGALFGSGRGLSGRVLAARTAAETASERAAARAVFLQAVAAGLPAPAPGAPTLAGDLLEAYDSDWTPVRPRYMAARVRTLYASGYEGVDEVLAVIRHGNLPHHPGLTSPVIAGLAAYLQGLAARKKDGATTFRLSQPELGAAKLAVTGLFAAPQPPEHYERLAGICRPLGAIIGYVGNSTDISRAFCTDAAKALRAAPTVALAGPLRPWIQGFAQRLKSGRASFEEKVVLQHMVADMALDKGLAACFQPVADAL